ncbi:MAG: transposase [Deltaproteobacteria bacterium]|nr:transposase [Deltaproteobacteria bacterium]
MKYPLKGTSCSVDRFHVMKQLNERLTQIRRTIQRKGVVGYLSGIDQSFPPKRKGISVRYWNSVRKSDNCICSRKSSDRYLTK